MQSIPIFCITYAPYVCIPLASKERPQENRRETTVRRVRAPMRVCVCVCYCTCVRESICVFAFVCAYMYVCVSASRVLKILLLLLSSSLLGLEGYGRCRKDIFCHCVRPEQPSVTSSPRRTPLKEKKPLLYAYRFARSWRVRHDFSHEPAKAPPGRGCTTAVPLSYARILIYFFFSFCFLAFVFCPRTGFFSSVILYIFYSPSSVAVLYNALYI